MQPDAARAADTKEWVKKARQDLRRAEILIAADPPDLEGSLFHSQQAAEKALKAFLTWHDVPFRRTHDLEVIGRQCLKIDASLAEPVARAEPLTPYAWLFRYPGSPAEPVADQAAAGLAAARKLLNAVLDRLPPDIR